MTTMSMLNFLITQLQKTMVKTLGQKILILSQSLGMLTIHHLHGRHMEVIEYLK